jgi:hypothetical protein
MSIWTKKKPNWGIPAAPGHFLPTAHQTSAVKLRELGIPEFAFVRRLIGFIVVARRIVFSSPESQNDPREQHDNGTNNNPVREHLKYSTAA